MRGVWVDRFDGVIFYHSELAVSRITDGHSQTYLSARTFWNRIITTTGFHRTMISRITLALTGRVNLSAYDPPLCDAPLGDQPFRFGSAHVTAFHMSYCDGSIHSVSYDIDPDVHRSLGSRNGNDLLKDLNF